VFGFGNLGWVTPALSKQFYVSRKSGWIASQNGTALMVDLSSQDVTRILVEAAEGNERAAARLLPLVYDELRLIARHRMAKTPPGNTLTPTALVHEAYLRIAGTERLPWESRKAFFAAAATAMRNILVDQARRKAAKKHGGDKKRRALDEADVVIEPPGDDVLALDEALSRLEIEEPDAGEVVTLLHFVGLTIEETAEVLQISARTVSRRWRYAKAWLHEALVRDSNVEVSGSDGC